MLRALRILVLGVGLFAAGAASAKSEGAKWDRALSQSSTRRALDEVLRVVKKEAKKEARAGHRPLVVVDLDDTVVDGRVRLQTAAKLAGLDLKASTRTATEMYKGLRKKARDEQRAIFNRAYFDDPKIMKLDRAQKGAAAFLKRVVAAGGEVAYASGRWERARAATEKQLRELGLPLASEKHLVLNPDERVHSLDFKRAVGPRLLALGKPVAFFENEPKAVVGYRAQFPEAELFRLRTWRGTPDRHGPARGVRVIKDFAR